MSSKTTPSKQPPAPPSGGKSSTASSGAKTKKLSPTAATFIPSNKGPARPGSLPTVTDWAAIPPFEGPTRPPAIPTARFWTAIHPNKGPALPAASSDGDVTDRTSSQQVLAKESTASLSSDESRSASNSIPLAPPAEVKRVRWSNRVDPDDPMDDLYD